MLLIQFLPLFSCSIMTSSKFLCHTHFKCIEIWRVKHAIEIWKILKKIFANFQDDPLPEISDGKLTLMVMMMTMTG